MKRLYLFFVLFIAAILFSSINYSFAYSSKIISNKANVRSAPSTKYPVLYTLKKDDEIIIEKMVGNWIKIVSPQEGWIYKKLLKIPKNLKPLKKLPKYAMELEEEVWISKLPNDTTPWENLCLDSTIDYCKNIGKKAHNSKGVQLKIGEILGVTWRRKGDPTLFDSPPSGSPALKKLAPRDSYYYIIEATDGYEFIRECGDIVIK